jgi:WD40 repeat protein
VAWWNESGKLLRRVERTAPILGLAWHPEGVEMAVLFGRPAQLVVATPESIATERATELKIAESPLAWRPDGQEIAIAMQDSPMLSWNPWKNNDSFWLRDFYSAGSTAFAWSPRGAGLAIGGVDGKILLIDADARHRGESRMALYGHRGRVNALRWIGTEDERLLSVGEDGSLRVWSDLWQSPEIRSIKFNEDLADAQWHPTDNKLAALVAGDEVQVLGGDTGSVIAAWALPPPCKPRASYRGAHVLWSPDGNQLAAICVGRPLAIWNALGEAIQVIATSGEEQDAQWMPDSLRLLVRREDGWSLLTPGENGNQPIENTASAVWVGGLDDGAIAVVSNGESGARVRRQNLGSAPILEVAVPSELRKVRCCALNADRTLLAVGGETGAVAWMDTRTGEWQRPAIQHAGPIRGLAWHPNGSRLISAGADATCRLFATAQRAQTWLLAHNLQSDTVATGWSADGRRLMIASAPRRILRINDASRSIDLQQSAEPKLTTRTERVLEACARIAAQPDEEAGWRALEKQLAMRANDDPDAAILLAAATLGAQAQYSTKMQAPPPNSKLLTHFEEVALPAAVQVAEACVLRDWPAVLKLCAEAQPKPAAASWFALAKAEALLQLGRRADAEPANLAAWTVRRGQSGAIETPMPPLAGPVDDAPRHVDFRAWANIQLNEDWSGGMKNSLSSLPKLVPQTDGYNFRCGEFLQLAGKTARTSGGYMLPRETGWIPFGCEARRVVLMIAACFIDAGEHYAGLSIGSVFLQRSDGRGAVRIPLVYGENIWDWWVPVGGDASDAPPEAIAWRGETPLSREQGKTAALFRLVWQAETGAPPVVAASLVSNLRRPAPFLVAITVGSAPPTTGAAAPTFP